MSLFCLSLSAFCLLFHCDGTCLYFIPSSILSCYFIVMKLVFILSLPICCHVISLWCVVWNKKKRAGICVWFLFFHAPFVPLKSIVSGYNFALDSNFFYKKTKTNMLLKGNDRQFSLENSRIKTRKFFWKKRNVHLEGENKERLSRMPKWTQTFCMTW